MPASSPYDWRFRLLGIPVRVSLSFWIVSLLLGGVSEPFLAVLWVVCVFVSILVHEFGHGLTARAFGYRPQVVLYGMGGLCASEAERQTPNQRLAVLFMGPGAQFLLLGLVMLFGTLVLGIPPRGHLSLARAILGIDERLGPFSMGSRFLPGGDLAWVGNLYEFLFIINLFWPLLNLLPIWPLDGGQITGDLLARFNPQAGRRWGHIVSMITAGSLAFYCLSQSKGEGSLGGILRVVFFGSFAFMNYEILKAYHQRYQMNEHDDDVDRWARS